MTALDFLRAEVARLRGLPQVTIEVGPREEDSRLALEAISKAFPALLGVLEEEIARHRSITVGSEIEPPWCCCGSTGPCSDPRIVSAAKGLGYREARETLIEAGE